MAEAEAWVMIPKSKNKGTEVVIDMRPLVLCKDCNKGALCVQVGMLPFVKCNGEDHELDWFCADGKRKEI